MLEIPAFPGKTLGMCSQQGIFRGNLGFPGRSQNSQIFPGLPLYPRGNKKLDQPVGGGEGNCLEFRVFQVFCLLFQRVKSSDPTIPGFPFISTTGIKHSQPSQPQEFPGSGGTRKAGKGKIPGEIPGGKRSSKWDNSHYPRFLQPWVLPAGISWNFLREGGKKKPQIPLEKLLLIPGAGKFPLENSWEMGMG